MKISSLNIGSNFAALQNSATLRLEKKCFDCIKDKIGKDFFEKNKDVDFVVEADCCSKFKLIATNARDGVATNARDGVLTNSAQNATNAMQNVARYENHGDCADFFKFLSDRNIKSDIEKSARVFKV